MRQPRPSPRRSSSTVRVRVLSEDEVEARREAAEDIAQGRAVEDGLVGLFESAFKVIGVVVGGAIRSSQREARRKKVLP